MFNNNTSWETNDYDGGYEDYLAFINPYENDSTEYSDLSFKQKLHLRYLTIKDRILTPLRTKWRDFRWNKLGIIYSTEKKLFSWAQTVNPARYGEDPAFIYTYNENGSFSVRRSA